MPSDSRSNGNSHTSASPMGTEHWDLLFQIHQAQQLQAHTSEPVTRDLVITVDADNRRLDDLVVEDLVSRQGSELHLTQKGRLTCTLLLHHKENHADFTTFDPKTASDQLIERLTHLPLFGGDT